MEKLSLTLNNELEFLIKYSLTGEEYMLFKVLFMAQDGDETYLYKYFNVLKSLDKLSTIRPMLLSLKDKGIIKPSCEIPGAGEEFCADYIHLNKTALNVYYRSSFSMFDELRRTYPKMFVVGEQCYQADNVTRYYRSFDDIAMTYSKAIRSSAKNHERVLEVLKWGIEKDLIKFSLIEFIGSRKWEFLEELMEDPALFEKYGSTVGSNLTIL